MKKKIFITLIIFLSLFCIAKPADAGVLDDVIQKGKNFFTYKNNGIKIKKDELIKTNRKISRVITAIGAGAAVVSITIMGFKFITSSAEGKADIKEALIPFTIGIIVIFGAYTIWQIVVTILNNVMN